jgi:hypothetical protein
MGFPQFLQQNHHEVEQVMCQPQRLHEIDGAYVATTLTKCSKLKLHTINILLYFCQIRFFIHVKCGFFVSLRLAYIL